MAGQRGTLRCVGLLPTTLATSSMPLFSSSPGPAAFRQKPSLPDFYSGATGLSGRFGEGSLLRRLQLGEISRRRPGTARYT